MMARSADESPFHVEIVSNLFNLWLLIKGVDVEGGKSGLLHLPEIMRIFARRKSSTINLCLLYSHYAATDPRC